jgi:general secretion pathway protein G
LEQIGSNLGDTSNQSASPAVKIKTSAIALWSLICGIAGFLIYLLLMLLTIYGLVPLDTSTKGDCIGIGLCLGIMGLILGIISRIRIKKLSGKLKGSAIAIIGLILSITVIIWMPILNVILTPLGPKKIYIAKIQISEFEQAIQTFHHDTLRYPTTDEGLEALVYNPRNLRDWKGPYLKKDVPRDPWGWLFHYHYPGIRNPDSYDLWSNGTDGIEGTKDDITNFK